MSIATAAFTANDTMTRVASASMNMGQVMLIRGIFATLLIGLLAWSQGVFASPRQARHPLLLLRAAAETTATVAFLVALSRERVAGRGRPAAASTSPATAPDGL